ncbi:hypothetical protein ACQ4PT_036431 [Festuca glaucescens]
MPHMQETECPVEPFKPKSQDNQKNTSYSVLEAADADEPFPFFGLLCYADALDWLLMVAGTIGSLMHGMAPAMSYYILGKAVDMFGNNIGNREAVVHELSKTLSHIKTVFSFVGENSAMKSFVKCMDKQYKLSQKEAFIKGLVTGRSAKAGESIAAVINILSGAIYLLNAAPDLQTFSQAKAAGKEVFKVIKTNPAICHESNGRILENVTGDIVIREVDFTYPSREGNPVIQGFSLAVPAGKIVALVGSSGCGKSTVISLVQLFYDAISGDIFIDGQNIKELDPKSLRRNIGSVSQEPSLFSGTISDNLRIGKINATDEEIIEAAKTANVHSFISKLPKQYSTEVGERGVQLSGGQKQRIAIARAILKNPPILLLDEATSALDSESEKLVQDALDRAMQGRTVILIAHRISTIINANKIVVMDNGRVAHSGTHEELLRKSVFYSSVCNMQNLEKKSGMSEERSTKEDEEQDNETSFSTHDQGKRIELTSKKPKQGIRKRTYVFYRIFLRTFKLVPGKVLLGSAAAAVSGISRPIFAFFIITVGMAYLETDAKRIVSKYSIILFLVGLVTFFSNIIQHYIYGFVGERAMNNLREALFSVILRSEVGWFEEPGNSVGFLTSRVVSDTSMIKTVISDRMPVIIQCISSVLIATVLSTAVNWRMGLVVYAMMPCHLIAGLVQVRSAKGFATDISTSHQKLISLTSEAVSNIRTVASFVQEEEILRKAVLALQEPMRIIRMESIKYGAVQGVALCLWHMTHAIQLNCTIALLEKGLATFENCVRSYQTFALTVPSITELWSLIPMVMTAISLLDPALDILDRETQIVADRPEVPAEEDRITGHIAFADVSFSYPSRTKVTVLDGFGLAIEPGQRVALVGPSGAGKSTVFSLLLRFYEPSKGKVLVDGKDIRDYNLKRLRRQIGLVQQEPILFNLSIRENISYGNEGVSEAEIVEAAMQANIHEFISSLSTGYDIVVGDKGSQLSGGQKQWIAIARTVLKDPAILLLDEATSALDGESERVVMSSLEAHGWRNNGELLGKTTSITIAHRLSTVVSADVIFVMDKGEVVEMGGHETLVSARNGLYSRIGTGKPQRAAGSISLAVSPPPLPPALPRWWWPRPPKAVRGGLAVDAGMGGSSPAAAWRGATAGLRRRRADGFRRSMARGRQGEDARALGGTGGVAAAGRFRVLVFGPMGRGGLRRWLA